MSSERPDSSRLPAPLRLHLLGVASLYTAFVVYGSLVPFRVEPLEFSVALERFRTALSTLPQFTGRADLAANFFLFVPLSFLWSGALCVDKTRGTIGKYAWILVSCAVIGFGIEFVQVWFPPRNSTLKDVLAQLLGSVAGIAMWQATGQAFVGRVQRSVDGMRSFTKLDRLLLAYLVGLVAYSLLPLDLTVSLTDFGQKYRSGKIQLLPFRNAHVNESGLSLLTLWGFIALKYVPVGAFMATGFVGKNQVRSVGSAAGWTAVASGVIECGKLFVLSAWVDTTSIALAGMGGSVGAWFARHWLAELPDAASLGPSDARSLVVAGLSRVWWGVQRVVSIVAFTLLLLVTGIALLSVLFSSESSGIPNVMETDTTRVTKAPPDGLQPDSIVEHRAVEPAPSGVAGADFGPPPRDPWAPVLLEPIELPTIPGAQAIWGALGQDSLGNIWFGVSAKPGPSASARLFAYDPLRGTVQGRGDVLTQLELLGKRRTNECQMKIHSRIVQAADGFLYFASMDEQGEQADGSRLPDWGSHLWRLHPSRDRWEHLAAVPEALIAVSGKGRYVYALGYFDHILYQYDTVAGGIRRIRVGSAGGHISRNFLSDANEHVYVPSVVLPAAEATASDAGRFRVDLVEFDAGLTEVGRTPLLHYGATLDDSSHGIIGFVHLTNGAIVFATHEGLLYQVEPRPGAAAAVTKLGWFHPEGTAYTASMFTFSGRRYVAGVGQRPGKPHEWLVYDLDERSSRAVPLQFSDPAHRFVVPYGSNVQDGQGCFYVAGAFGGLPQLVRVHRSDSAALASPSNMANLPPTPMPATDPIPPVVRPERNALPDSSHLASVILHGTVQEWLGATVGEQQAMAEFIADLLQAELPDVSRQEWALRYRESIDSLAHEPHGSATRIVDWLPLVHGLLVHQYSTPAAPP